MFNKTKKETKPKNVTARQAANAFITAAKEFEESRIADIEKSRAIAWRVAIGACTMSAMAMLAVVGLTPLKEVQPYVIRIDNNTGATDIVTTLRDAKSGYGDETAKFFSANYVRLMEGYDWYTIQNQVNQLMMFSDADMQSQINKKFSMPNAPHKLYKDKQRINITINNVSIIDEKGLLQVRFTKSVEPMSGGVYNPTDDTVSPKPIVSNHIATIGYEYVNVPTVDDVRLVNPLGYTVKSYRVDDDMIGGTQK